MRAICLTSVLLICGCIDINLPERTSLGSGTIVLEGQMSESANSACPLWVADNGLQLVLFQTTRVSNADFDELVLPGTTSRLELKGRADIEDVCAPGAENAEVVQILEVNGKDAREANLQELRDHVDDLVEGAKTKLSEKREEIAEGLRDLADQAETNLEARKEELRQTIDDIYESIVDRLEARETMRERLDDFVSDAQQQIEDAEEEFEDAKEQLAENLRDRIEEFVENLRDSIYDELEELRERLEDAGLDQGELKDRLTNAVNEIRGRVESELEQKRQEILARLEQLRQQFEDSWQAWLDELRDRIPGDLPDPDEEIPPILDDALTASDDLVMELQDDAQGFIDQTATEFGTTVDQLRNETDVAVEEAFIGYLEDSGETGAVNNTAQ